MALNFQGGRLNLMFIFSSIPRSENPRLLLNYHPSPVYVLQWVLWEGEISIEHWRKSNGWRAL